MINNSTKLLLAGLAAFGYYKYSKMTPEQKKSMIEKGKDLLNKNFGGLENIFGRRTVSTGPNGSNPI